MRADKTRPAVSALGAACCVMAFFAFQSPELAAPAAAARSSCLGGTTVAHDAAGRLFYTGELYVSEQNLLSGCLYAVDRRRVVAVSHDGMSPEYFVPRHSALAGTFAAVDLVSTVLDGGGNAGPHSNVLVEQLRNGRRRTTSAWHGGSHACEPLPPSDPCAEEILGLVLAPTGQAAWSVVDTTIETTLRSEPPLSDPAATYAVYATSTTGAITLLESSRQIHPHSLRLSNRRMISWISGETTHSAALP